MRFMVVLKANEETESDALPSPEVIEAMGRYNAALAEAGVLLAAEGVHASLKGARVSFTGPTPTVTDGPFTEIKELIAGFWILQVRSMEEAVEWVKRAPLQGAEVEIRQVVEADDLGDAFSPEARAAEDAVRARLEER